MGADIYLESVSDKLRAAKEKEFNDAVKVRNAIKDDNSEAFKQAQAKVSETYDAMYADGYFRDSYNGSSLFWVLGLSWWNDVGDLLDEGYLPIPNAKKLLKMVQDAPLTLETVQTYLNEQNKKGETYKDTAQEWFDHWVKKRQNFIEMLHRSIELNEPLRCSI